MTQSEPRRLDAVVMGASAGGVEALLALLTALPRDFPTPILVVLHIPRDRPSLLVSLFSRRCALAVREAEDKEPLLPGTVYFAPPDYHLLVDAGPCAALSVDPLVQYSRPSIDVLFEAAADLFRRRVLAVLLTGANSDGARGCAAVRAAGGLVMVQDPDEAQVRYMPEAALRLGAPDFLLRLEQMPDTLLRLARGPGA